MRKTRIGILFIFFLAVSLFAFQQPGACVRLDDADVIQTAAPDNPAASPAAPATSATPGEPREITLAVLNFGDGPHAPGIGRAVSDMIIGVLAGDPLVRIFERARLDEILEEQKRLNPSDMDGNTIRAAREVGVQFVLMGKVSEFGINQNGVLIPGKGTVTQYKARATLDVRMISVADASVIKTWTTTGSETSYNLGVNILGIPNFTYSGREFEESLLGKATRQAVDSSAAMIREDVRGPQIQSFAASYKLTGKVADVDGGNLILNIGATAGVAAGQSLGIYRVGKQIKDPDTGEILVEKRERIGRALVVHVEDRFSEAAVMSLIPGASVQVGDLVEAEEPESPRDTSDN